MAYANKKGVSWLLLCTSKEVTRCKAAEALSFQDTKIKGKELDSGFRRNDEQRKSKRWIPAFAGMTS
jgi:hypothetical protein